MTLRRYRNAIGYFRNDPLSRLETTCFGKSYGSAVLPTIGKAGLGVGGAHASGCVYAQGKQVGTAKMNQLSFGWHAGAQGYSLLVLCQDERSFKEFTSGNFEFGAKASAVAA